MKNIFILSIIFLILTGCANRESGIELYKANNNVPKATKNVYSVNGKVYFPKQKVPIGWTQKGIASWYGPNFHGKYTSDGEIYNMYALTAAHKTLPMNTIVKVTNLNNGRSVIVRINDRGPFVRGRIIDLSYAAGKKIGLNKTGIAPVKLKVIGFRGKNYVNGYMIQVGAFRKYKGALLTAKKYKKLGYNTKIKDINGLKKVFIIGFNSYKKAQKFKKRHNLNGFIIGE